MRCVAVAAGLLALVLAACSTTEPALGTVLESSSPATPFELRDQFGHPVNLAGYRGKVVALTFLYTYCPDICPIVAAHLQQAHRKLGDDADQVAFVAVSVDPARDTVERAYAYSEKCDMLNSWAFLVGGEEELAPIWKAYYIDPAVDDRAGDGSATETRDASQRSGVDALRQGLVPRYNVVHSAPVYLIDREGLMRVLFTLPFEPDDLVHNIRLLLD